MKNLFGCLSIVSLLFLQACTAVSQPVAERPKNTVFIMVDDLGYADLGCYGGTAIPTPNLDRMAEEGIRFTDAYSACTVCGPARSSLMDGKHMGRTSMRLNTGGVPILDEDRTLAEMLQDAGYATAGFGKWGLGELGTEGQAHLQGFDVFYGYYHQIHAHYYLPDYLIRNGEKEMLPGNAGFYQTMPHQTDGAFPRVDPQSGLERQFASDLIFEETLQYIRGRAASDQPFFCYAAWTPPHGEYKIPEDDPAWQMFKDRDWPVRAKVVAAYDAMLDRQVGELLALLAELNLDEDTVVFFLSDHGADQRYDGVLDSSGELRGAKRSMCEGGLRVPMIVRCPGLIEPGQVSDHPCYFPDVMPTLADLAGIETPDGIDGLSYMPTLAGDTPQQQAHDYLYWEWHQYDWGRAQLVPDGLWQAARVGDWKAIRWKTGEPLELYNLSTDLGEAHNVAADHPDIVAQMERILQDAHEPMRPQREPQRVNGQMFR